MDFWMLAVRAPGGTVTPRGSAGIGGDSQEAAGLAPLGEPVLEAVDAAVYTASDGDERGLGALVGQQVQVLELPEVRGDQEAHPGGGGQLRVPQQVQPEALTEGLVVGPAGDLDGPAAPEALTIAGLGVAQVLAALVAELGLGGSPELVHV